MRFRPAVRRSTSGPEAEADLQDVMLARAEGKLWFRECEAASARSVCAFKA